jgi:hypothetical protein
MKQNIQPINTNMSSTINNRYTTCETDSPIQYSPASVVTNIDLLIHTNVSKKNTDNNIDNNTNSNNKKTWKHAKLSKY